MLKEYVLEPEVLHEIVKTRRDLENFKNEFSIGQPRILSDFPKFKRFRSRVLQESPYGSSSPENERLTALVSYLSELPKVKRSSQYQTERSWAQNICDADNQCNIDYTVLKQGNKQFQPNWVALEDLLCGLPRYKKQADVLRTAAEMSSSIASMLRLATKIVFVDPYFSDKPRMWEPLLAFLAKATTNKPTSSVSFEVLYKEDDGRPTPDFLATKFEREQLSLLPKGSSLKFSAIKEKASGGEKIHNRYVITDIGGVYFGIGLDEDTDNPHHTDDVTLLGELYQKRYEQYVELRAFDLVASAECLPS